MFLEAVSLFRPSQSTAGQVMLDNYYTGTASQFHFPYPWFNNLPLLPEPWIQIVVMLLGLSGLILASGMIPRVSAAMAFLAWGYLYAVESTRTYWMSYYYLELLTLFLLIWMPKGTSLLSILRKDSWIPIPFWPVFLLRSQLVITYFYAGLAKINTDWLIHLQPVRYFIDQPHVLTSSTLINRVLKSDFFAYFISYGGAAFDLSVGFLLLFKRTRFFGMMCMFFFHGVNHFLLFEDIVWFPLLGVSTATIFLKPDWPVRVANQWKRFYDGQENAAKSFVNSDINTVHWKPKRYVPALVWVWIGLQVLIPLRHYGIPGDARFTFEGLSFSWRLKAEVYRAVPCEIRLVDEKLISENDPYEFELNWNEWDGDRVLYRPVAPNRIDWSDLPEILTIFDTELGDRILFNPLASAAQVTSETQGARRVKELWMKIFNREPTTIQSMMSVDAIRKVFEEAYSIKFGVKPMPGIDMLEAVFQDHGRHGDGNALPALRRILPFALQGATPPNAGFLLIEDDALLSKADNQLPKIDRNAWKCDPPMKSPRDSLLSHSGDDPLVLYTADLVFEKRDQFPQACLVDHSSEAFHPISIWWDYLRELGPSKGMHISTQPFLLRRYAINLADRWETATGNRPSVFAMAQLSLNFRDLQSIVAPQADLASVPVSYWKHNPWIHDLKDTK